MRVRLTQRDSYPLGSEQVGELEVRSPDGEHQYTLDLVWFHQDGPDFLCAGKSVLFMRMVQLRIYPASAVQREHVSS